MKAFGCCDFRFMYIRDNPESSVDSALVMPSGLFTLQDRSETAAPASVAVIGNK